MGASATVEAQMKHSGRLVRVPLPVSSVLCPWLFSLLGYVSVLVFAREIVMLKRVLLAVLMSLVLVPVSSAADRNERLEEAKQLIEKALELLPEEATIIDSLGWVRYRMGDLPGALALLSRAYTINDDPEIAAHLGEVLWMLGRREEAKKTWEDATRAHPNNAVLATTVKRFLP